MSAIAPEAAARFLKIDASRVDDVRDVLRRAESHIADRVGPLVETVVVERLRGTSSLVLSTTPVISVVSVVSIDGATLDVSGLYQQGEVLMWSDERSFTGRAYTVTYKAGWAPAGGQIPGGLETAVLELLRHLWRSSERGGGRRPGTSTDDSPAPGFLLPYAVQSALDPYLPVNGFA